MNTLESNYLESNFGLNLNEIIAEIKRLYDTGDYDKTKAFVKTNLNYRFGTMTAARKLNDMGVNLTSCGFHEAIAKAVSGAWLAIENIGYSNYRLKLATSKDSGNDRAAWGDKKSERFDEGRFMWRFQLAEGSDMDYYIINKGNDKWGEMRLKLATSIDSAGDRQAFGDYTEGNTDRYKWFLLVYPNENDFAIFSCCKGTKGLHYAMPLKLGVDKDAAGDRILWGDGENGAYTTEQQRMHWMIK